MPAFNVIVRFLTTLILAASVATAAPRVSNNGLVWGHCMEKKYLPLTCAQLRLPYDHSKFTPEWWYLYLYKIPAKVQPSKGSVFVNFGGPGVLNSDYFLNNDTVADLQANTGGEYDLITFNQRGVYDSLPVSCFISHREKNTAMLGALSPDEFEYWYASDKIWTDKCAPKIGRMGTLLGTAFVVRDMLAAVDALNEDGMLRYIGFSYGTVLGATFAAMFPDRIDKMVLDGVDNPHEWYHGFRMEENADTNKVLNAFFEACVANPGQCALARRPYSNMIATAAELKETFLDAVDRDEARHSFTGKTVNGHLGLAAAMYHVLYKPSTWPDMASALYNLWYLVDNEALRKTPALQQMRDEPVNPQDRLRAITCADRPDRFYFKEELRPTVEALRNRRAWDVRLEMSRKTLCTSWPIRALERYQGDFNVKTNNPILIVSSALDPVTPLASAQNVSAAFEGSVLIQTDGYGHTSLAQKSSRCIRAIRDYFVVGTLPRSGTVYPVDVPLFWLNAAGL